jgi:CxxC motif-containing protein (DUF1111 family)
LTSASCGGLEGPETTESVSSALTGDSYSSGLTAAQQTEFSNGQSAFAEIETVADGLGPVFNEKECGTCHDETALGGAGVQIETRAGQLSNGVFNPLTAYGGTLFQHFGIGGAVPNAACTNKGQVVPSIANVVTGRVTTPLFGLGLVDATPDATFQAIAAAEPSSIRGTSPTVTVLSGDPTHTSNPNHLGRFGWKDQNPSLFQFAADAYVNEMGITNPLFPNENVPQGTPGGQVSQTMLANCDSNSGISTPDPEDDGTDIKNFTNFMLMLAPASRGTITQAVTLGDAEFTREGCDGCHVRNITSGTGHDTAGNVIAAISNVTYHPFSDFLLHDMGSLNDGIDQGTGTHMRTAPLWGLRLRDNSKLTHAGNQSLAGAIRAHAGQGAAAAAAFSSAGTQNQNNLMAFLTSL